MKSAHFPLSRLAVLFFCFNLFYFTAYSQVGIGTTNPDANAKLDITSTAAEPGGLLLPRMALTGTNSTNPLTAHVAGMTVYNTATNGTGATRVTPGYYYNDGANWVRLASSAQAQDNWSLTGNAGTTPGVNFLGTMDNQALRFRTRNIDRFEITDGNVNNGGRLRAFSNGTAAWPIYSWESDPNTGMYSINDDVLGFSTGGSERVRVSSNGNVGIGANNPSQRLQVNGNLRLDGAFMPGNQAGGIDKILLSQGAGNAPTWGPGFLNTTQISNIGKYYVGPFNVSNNQVRVLTVLDPNMTVDTSIAYNFIGTLPPGPLYGYEVTLLAESQNGQIVFYVVNAGSGFNLMNMQIVYTAFYN